MGQPQFAPGCPSPWTLHRRLGFSPGVSSLGPLVCAGGCRRFLLLAPRRGSGGSSLAGQWRPPLPKAAGAPQSHRRHISRSAQPPARAAELPRIFCFRLLTRERGWAISPVPLPDSSQVSRCRRNKEIRKYRPGGPTAAKSLGFFLQGWNKEEIKHACSRAHRQTTAYHHVSSLKAIARLQEKYYSSPLALKLLFLAPPSHGAAAFNRAGLGCQPAPQPRGTPAKPRSPAAANPPANGLNFR